MMDTLKQKGWKVNPLVTFMTKVRGAIHEHSCYLLLFGYWLVCVGYFLNYVPFIQDLVVNLSFRERSGGHTHSKSVDEPNFYCSSLAAWAPFCLIINESVIVSQATQKKSKIRQIMKVILNKLGIHSCLHVSFPVFMIVCQHDLWNKFMLILVLNHE